MNRDKKKKIKAEKTALIKKMRQQGICFCKSGHDCLCPPSDCFYKI